jgi:hypothetical protein
LVWGKSEIAILGWQWTLREAEEGMCGRRVEAIEQPIAAIAS